MSKPLWLVHLGMVLGVRGERSKVKLTWCGVSGHRRGAIRGGAVSHHVWVMEWWGGRLGIWVVRDGLLQQLLWDWRERGRER